MLIKLIDFFAKLMSVKHMMAWVKEAESSDLQ